MAKKSQRSPIGLNLTPELPEVVSRDFNLFYTPQKEPEVAGLKEFTSALDNFVNNGGTKAVLLAEGEEKKLNVSQANQDYLQNKLDFKDAITQGKIDATANPYYLEKYKELTLNSYASQFADKLGETYRSQDVVNDIRAGSFEQFYKNELGNFIKTKELGYFNPLDLEKGFFKETSSYRNQLENNHRQAQLKLFKEKFEEKVSDRIGTIINQFKDIDNDVFAGTQNGYDKYNLMGDSINALVKDLIDVNGNGRETIDTVFKGLQKWATTTNDIELAKRVISELPSKILGGTDSIENVGRIKRLKQETLDILVEKSAERTSKNNQLSKGLRERDQLDTYEFLARKTKEDPNFDVNAWSSQKGITGSQKQGASDFLKDLQFDRGASDNPAVLRKINDLVTDGNYAEAYSYTREQYAIGNLREDTKNKFISEHIRDAQSGKYDAVLQNPLVANELASLNKRISSEKLGDNPQEAGEFKNYITTKLRQWYKANASSYTSQYALDNAIEKEYISLVKDLKSLGKYQSLFGAFDDSLRFGEGNNLTEKTDNAIKRQKQIEENNKQKLRDQNKNLNNAEFQKYYNDKQLDKQKIKYGTKEEQEKALKKIEKDKELEGLRAFNAWKERPIGERLKEAFDINANRPKKPKEPNDKK
jgi:hypothetical protein